MTSPYKTTDDEIMRACGYIKSDSYISMGLGVSEGRVAQIRQRLERQLAARAGHDSEIAEVFLVKDAEHRVSMERGSSQLINAISRESRLKD